MTPISHSAPAKPNFLIVGSGKCGTTTLARLLAEHPDCCFGRTKEVRYFSHDENFARGTAWYLDFFSHYRGERAVGEATPNYAVRPVNQSAARIHAFDPAMKIVFTVRHPYAKMVSEWKMDYFADRFRAREGFERYLRHRADVHQVLYHCCFDYQMEAYRDLFPEAQILILFLEDWARSPETEARKLCDFLGIAHQQLPPVAGRAENTAADKRKERTYFTRLRQATWLRPLWKLIPAAVNRRAGDLIGKKELKYPPAHLSPAYKRHVVDFMRDDAQRFLVRYGKPADFWSFEHV